MNTVNGKHLNVEVDFSANTSKASQEIKKLQSELDKVISTMSKSSSNGDTQLAKQLRDASLSAMELKRHLESATNVQTGKLDLSLFKKSLNSAGKDLEYFRKSIGSCGPEGEKAFATLTRSIATAEVPLRRSSKLLNEFATTLKNTARWQISSSILHGFMGSLQSAFGYAKDLNESLNNIRIVTGQSTDQMAQFASEANKAAKELSTTTTKYTDAALIYYQQGLSDEEVKKRTDVTVKMANVSRQSAEEVSSQMTAVWNNFNKAGDQAEEHFADVMTSLGAKTASSSSEIAEGLSKFAGIADTVGLSFDYAASALATITATSRESADVVGTSLKTIFSRLEGLKLGETLEDGTELNQYSMALQKIGVNIKDASGELKDMDTILDETGEKWQNLTQDQKMATAQTVAGVRQYNQFITLMDNWDFMEKNIQKSKEATGTLQEQADIYAESWEASEKRVQAAAEEIYNALIDEDFFIDLNDGLTNFLELISDTIKGLGGLKGVLLVLGTLVTKIFSKQIGNSLNNLFSTQKGRMRDYVSLQEENLNSAAKQAEKNNLLETQGNYEKIKEYNEKMIDASEGKSEYQIQKMKDMGEELRLKVEEVEALEKESLLLKEQAKLEEKKLSTIQQESIKKTRQAEHERDAIVNRHRGPANKETKNLIDEATAKMDKEIARDTTLSNSTLKKTEAFKQLTAAFKGNEAEAERYINKQKALVKAQQEEKNAVDAATKAHKEKEREYNKKVEEIGDKNKDIQDTVNNAEEDFGKIKDESLEMGDVITKTANGVMSLTMALSTLKGLGDIWSDQDMSTGEKILTTITSLSMVLPMLASGFKDLKAGVTGFGPALLKLAANAGVVGATEEGATIATVGWGAALKGVAASALTAIAPFAAIVAGVVALGFAISAASDAWNANVNAAKEAAETAAGLQDELNSVKTAYDDINNTLSDYNEARTALKDMTVGTQEWKQAVIELNQQVLDLINKYPDLAKSVKNVDGILEIDSQTQQKFLDQQLKRIEQAQQASLAGQIISNKASEKDKITQEARKKTGNDDFLGSMVVGFANAGVQATRNEVTENYEKNLTALVDAYERNGEAVFLNTEAVTANSEETKNNFEETKNLVRELAASREATKQESQQATKKILEDKNFYGSKGFEAFAGKAYEDILAAQTALFKDSGKLSNFGFTDEEVQQKYATQMGYRWLRDEDDNKGTYLVNGEEKTISDEVAREALAVAKTEEVLSNSLEDLQQKFEKLEKEVQNTLGGTTKNADNIISYLKGNLDFNELTQAEIDALVDSKDKIKNFAESHQEELGLKDEDIEPLMDGLNDSLKDQVQNYIKQLPQSVRDAFNKLDTDEMSVGGAKALADALSHAILMGGDQAQQELETIFDKAQKNGSVKEFGELLEDIDWGTTDVDSFKDSLKEIGITTNLTDAEFNNLINSMKDTSDSAEDLTQKYADIHKVMDGLKDGDTISPEDYEKLGDAGKGYFAKMLDGTYKLIGSAEEFKKRTQENLVAQAQANIEQLKNKKQGMNSLKDYDFEELSQSSERPDAETIQQKINLIQQLGEVSYDAQLKIDKWAEASRKNAITSDMMKEIDNEVQSLTEKYPTLKDAIEGVNAEIQQQYLAIALTATSMRELDDLLEQGSINQTAYDQALLQMHNEERMEGLDTEEIKNYSNYLQDLAENVEDAKIGSDKLSESLADNRDVAEDITIQIARMNGAVETLADNWKEWSEILRTSSVGSEEYYQAQLGVKKALADLFDVSEDYISLELVDEFAKDEEAMKLMAKAAKGDGDAIDQLREKASQDIIARIRLEDNVNTDEFDSIWKNIQNIIDNHSNEFNVAVGAEIKNDSFIDALQQMVDKAGLSVDQINTVLSSMGYEAQFEADDQVMQTKVPVITKRHTVVPGPTVEMDGYDDRGFASKTQVPTWDETEEIVSVDESTQDVTVPAWALGTIVPGKPAKKPTIKSVHKKANGSANNFSKSNPGGKAPGKKSGKKGKGGGKQKKEKTPQYSDEFDRYWQLNQTIKKTTDALNALGKAQEYAFGNEKIKNINKQNALLQVQLKNVRALHKAQEKERDNELKKTGKKKYGAKFDKDGYLANYNKITHKELKRYTKALKSGNEKTIEAAKNRYEAFKKWLNRYEKLTQDELVQSKEKIQEILRQIVEGNISKIETKFQFDVDTRDAKRTWDKFLKDISNGLKNTFSAFKDYSFFGDALDNDVKTVKDKAKEVKDAVEWANKYKAISKDKKSWKEYTTKTKKKDRIASSRSEAQELARQWKEKAETAGNDALSALQDGLNQITGYIQEFGNKLDFINKEFQEQQDILNYNKELIELAYGDKAYDLMESYYNAQGTLLENQKESLETQKNSYEEIWKKDKEIVEAAGRTWDPNDMSTWSDAGVEAYNKMIDCSKELRNVNLELVKTLKEDYLNAVSKVIDEHERLVTGGLSLDEASEQWERVREEADHYLDATERTYQVQTLMNKIDQSISDTKSVKAAKQLTELREKELKYLSEKNKLTKYDLDAANARYNIALKEIALQEAQNNKNTMKLTRNEQGNWTYQYVANQDDIKAKEQELMDANYNYYEMAKSNYMGSVEDMINLEKEYSKQLYQIESIRLTNEEEYNRKKEALDKWYEEKRKRIVEENSLFQQDMIISGMSVLQTQYDIDKSAFEQLNADKLGFIEKLKENGTTNFQELFDAFGGYSEKAGERMVTAILGGDKDKTKAAFPQVTQGLINLVESAKTSLIGEKTSLSKVFESAGQTIINNWRNNPDGIENQLLKSYDVLNDKAKDISEKIIKITGGKEGIKGAFEKAAGKAKDLNDKTNTFCKKVKKEFPNLVAKIKNLASAYDKVAKAAKSSKKAVVELNKAVKNTKPPKVGKDTKQETYTVKDGGNSNSKPAPKSKVKSKVKPKPKKPKAKKYKITYSNRVLAKNLKTKAKAEEKIRDKIAYYEVLYNAWMGGHGKMSAQQANERTAWNNAKIKEYKTGGYTGSWGDNGKLAVLHQKELVLNKEDTKNMLDAVSAIREIKDLNSSISKTISDSLGSIVLNAVQTMKSGTLVNTDKDKSQQGIVIENITAEFPNAENVNEIRQAILSLPQLASQYVSRNLK